MSLPNQIIPYEEKTEKWAEECARAVLNTSRYQTEIHNKTRFCYNFYNGIVNQTDFDYLRKSGDFEYPALVRNIPLMKTMFKNLLSDEMRRPFNFVCITTDKDSLRKKYEVYKNASIDFLEKKARERIQNIEQAQIRISAIEQQIQAAQEKGQEIPTHVLQGLNEQKQILHKQEIVSQKEIEDFEKEYKRKYKDILEGLSEKGLKYLMRTQLAPLKFNQGLEDIIICDREIYFVEVGTHMKDPQLNLLDPNHFYYSMDDVDWINDCQWGMYERLMSPEAIVNRWPNIKKEMLEEIGRRSFKLLNYTTAGFHSWNGYYQQQSNNNVYYNDNILRGSLTRVACVYWMSPCQIYFYKTKDELGFETENVTRYKKDVPHGVEYDIRYINEQWEAYVVDADVVIYAGRSEYQIYDSEWKHIGIPFIGRNNWGRRLRNSLVWETKDIQIMYNLVHYHKELWLALSGVKGFIMDKSQIPDDMTPEEWMYQRKMGVGWIETVKKNKKVNSSFNQFQHYDDTISSSVQYLLNMLQHYEKLASYVTGVSQQRLGMFVPTDQVGTSNMAIEQSSLTTEILFIEHEYTKRQVLKYWINACRITWKDGREDQYLDSTGHVIFCIPKGEFSKCDFEVHVTDGGEERNKLKMLQQLAMQGRNTNTFDIPMTAKMMLIDNVKELENAIDYYSDMAMERLQSEQQNALMSQQEQSKMNAEIQQMAENQKFKLENAKLEIEKERLNFDIRSFEQELELEKAKIETDSSDKRYDTDVERDTEMLYLDFEKKKAIYDAQINKLKIQLDAVNKQLDIISKEKQKEKVKDK